MFLFVTLRLCAYCVCERQNKTHVVSLSVRLEGINLTHFQSNKQDDKSLTVYESQHVSTTV